jgi:hypothetical protein
MTFGTESTFIAPVKYPALSQVTLAASHLAHPVSAQPCLLCSKIVKKAWDILPKETFAVIIAASLASDLSAAFLGKQHVYTAGEAIVWAAALGPASAARAALVAKPLAPFGGVRSAIWRIVKSFKATFKFDDATAIKFSMHPFFSGCTNWLRLE